MRRDGKKKKLHKQYEKEGEKIISTMFNILDRAQKKVNSESYRKTVERLLRED